MITPYVDESDMDLNLYPFSASVSSPLGGVHQGLDFFPNGDRKEFRAVSSGLVESVETNELEEGGGEWGSGACIRYNDSFIVCYAFEPVPCDRACGELQHSLMQVEVGQTVRQGDVIGTLLQTGDYSHVDFGLLHAESDYDRICPEEYFTEEAAESIYRLLQGAYPDGQMCYL